MMNNYTSSLEYKTNHHPTMDDAIMSDLEIFHSIKAYRLASMGGEGLKYVIDVLNLEPFLEFMASFNGSNHLPYHNFYHATCVALNCYEGAYFEKVEDEALRGMIAGALMHDFNHSGGKLDDTENIKMALAGLKSAQAYAKSQLLGLTDKEYQIACETIAITKYPFETEPLLVHERIIRDADLMQPYEESMESIHKQYLGLKEEIETQRGQQFTIEEFAAGIRDFQDTQTVWYTSWGTKKANDRDWEEEKSVLTKILLCDK